MKVILAGAAGAAILRYNKKERVLTGGFTPNHKQSNGNDCSTQSAAVAKRAVLLLKLHTDSQYLKRAFTDGWLNRWHSNGWLTSKKQPVKNQDLWRDLWSEVQKHEVQWIKVKAHANNKLNNRADALGRGCVPECCSRVRFRNLAGQRRERHKIRFT